MSEKTSNNNGFNRTKLPKRRLRFEIGDGTPEGICQDCATLDGLDFWSVFIRIPECGDYLNNSTQAQRGFLSFMVQVYDGSATVKSIKTEDKVYYVNNIPVNCLAYSDTNKVLNNKAGKTLDDMLDGGLVRRTFITYMEDKPLTVNEDMEADKATKAAAFKYGEKLSQKLFEIFEKIPKGAVYSPNEEAYKRYYKYETDNKKEYNRTLKTSEDIVKKELRGRHWKTLKLSALIAALQNPESTEITLEDMEYAIYMSDLFADSFNKFFKLTPKTGAEKLFDYFKENKGKWLTTSEIDKQKFVNRARFSQWFKENLSLVYEIAAMKGYEIKHETFGGKTGNSGNRYMFVENNIGKELNPEIAEPNDLIK